MSILKSDVTVVYSAYRTASPTYDNTHFAIFIGMHYLLSLIPPFKISA